MYTPTHRCMFLKTPNTLRNKIQDIMFYRQHWHFQMSICIGYNMMLFWNSVNNCGQALPTLSRISLCIMLTCSISYIETTLLPLPQNSYLPPPPPSLLPAHSDTVTSAPWWEPVSAVERCVAVSR